MEEQKRRYTDQEGVVNDWEGDLLEAAVRSRGKEKPKFRKDDPKGFGAAVEEIQNTARSFVEDIPLPALCEDIKQALQAGNKAAFLNACRRLYSLKAKNHLDDIDAWLSDCGAGFDSLLTGKMSKCCRPLGFGVGDPDLVITRSGENFTVCIKEEYYGSFI